MPRISGVTGWLAKSTPGEAGLSSPCFLTLGLTDLVLLGFVRVEGFFSPHLSLYHLTFARLDLEQGSPPARSSLRGELQSNI